MGQYFMRKLLAFSLTFLTLVAVDTVRVEDVPAGYYPFPEAECLGHNINEVAIKLHAALFDACSGLCSKYRECVGINTELFSTSLNCFLRSKSCTTLAALTSRGVKTKNTFDKYPYMRSSMSALFRTHPSLDVKSIAGELVKVHNDADFLKCARLCTQGFLCSGFAFDQGTGICRLLNLFTYKPGALDGVNFGNSELYYYTDNQNNEALLKLIASIANGLLIAS